MAMELRGRGPRDPRGGRALQTHARLIDARLPPSIQALQALIQEGVGGGGAFSEVMIEMRRSEVGEGLLKPADQSNRSFGLSKGRRGPL